MRSIGRPVVAIVGAGFSGTALAAQMLRLGRRAPNVVLIEKRGRFGPGLAYSSVDRRHLLNVRAGAMTADPLRPDDFVEWIADRGARQSPALAFASRATYGAYLEARLRRAIRNSAPNAITLVRDAAVDCALTERGARLTLSSGRKLDCDAVVLALGNQPPATPAPFEPSQLIDPWDRSAIASISPDEDVLCIGAGLTMVDVALSLTAAPRTGRIYALSRRGLTPRPHAEHVAREAGEPCVLRDTLGGVAAALRADVRAAMRRGGPWQHEFDRIRPVTAALWRSFSLQQQRRFLRHARPWWDAHRHRMAPHVAAWIEAMRNAKTLHVVAGRVRACDSVGGALNITYWTRQGALQSLTVRRIVNCTGPDANLERARDPLIQNMLANGLARPHPLGLGFDVAEDGRLLDERGNPRERVFALGPLTQGAFWEATAVPEIRDRAAALAGELSRLTQNRRGVEFEQAATADGNPE